MRASIGIALSKPSASDPEGLLRDADAAMYRAKALGKGRYALFDESMFAAAKNRLNLESELRHALDRDDFELHYQPIVDLSDGCITGFEALLRWRSADGSYRSPSDFIHIAEETGLIVPLGWWILEQACKQLLSWRKQAPESKAISMSVNISKRQLLEPGFARDFERVLSDTGMEAKYLNLEVTESTVLDVAEHVPGMLRSLRKLGCSIHMDDFGTGYSSLSCLHRYPLDVIKIDRSFILTMGADRNYSAVVQSILLMAKHLNMKVVAEGIEGREELAPLLALDCTYGQGYYFAKPTNARSALNLIISGGEWSKPLKPAIVA